MKRSVLILSLAAFVLSSNAQVLKSNLLNGYKQGDKLEKATYNKADAPIKIDTWCEAFSSQTDKNAGSPITGQELSYEGYTEKGVSIKIGELPVNPEKPDVPLNKNDAFQKVQKRHVQEKR